LSMDDWTPAADSSIVSKYIIGQRAYRLYVTTTGALVFTWTTDGTTVLSKTSTVPSHTNGSIYWVRATLDVNDGSGNHVVRFYTSPNATNEPQVWTQLSEHTTAGTTSIYAGTSELDVGSNTSGTSGNLAGNIYRAIVKSGIGVTGTVVADFDPYDALSASSSSWKSARVDGQTWTVGSGASLGIAPTWTDITADVRDGVTILRGKQSEIPTFASSSLSLVLNNRHRRYDPEYTGAGAPYNGNIEPRKRIRVRAVWNDTVYTLWSGYVESWPQRYPMSNFDSVVELTAFDSLALLNDVVLEDAAYTYAVARGSLLAAVRDMTDGQWRDDISGAIAKRRQGVIASGDKMTVGPGTAVAFDGNTSWSFGPVGNGGLASLTSDRTIALWATVEPSASTRTLLSNENLLGTTSISVQPTGEIRYLFAVGGSAYGKPSIEDGVPHHIAVTTSGTTVKVYVDGVDVTDTADTLTPLNGYAFNVIGASAALATGAFSNWLTGSISDIYVWGKALSAAQIQQFYRLSLGSLTESTELRAERLLADAGVPLGLYAINNGAVGVVADIDTYEQSALSALQTVADSEQGRMFVDVRGRITMQDRYWWDSSARGGTSQATFSDDLADLYYTDVSADRNLREVQNSITVSGSAGTRSTAADSTSVDTYGTRAASIATLLSSQNQVVDLAYGLLQLRKDPVTRLDAITLQPALQDSAWPKVLNLELGDRVTFEIMPARGAASTSQLVRNVIVERLDWTLGLDDWRCEITGSPVPSAEIFTLDSSALTGTDLLGF
jgi:hypothetical protein